MFDAAIGITKGKGVRGLYSGLGVTMVEIMPYAALQFGLYDALQIAWKKAQVLPLSSDLGCACFCTNLFLCLCKVLRCSAVLPGL